MDIPSLFEIFNTKPDVKWTGIGGNYAGFFTLEGVNFNVYIDQISYDRKKIIDVGFKTEGRQDIFNSGISIGKILGAVINSLIPKIDAINPDIIVVVVMKTAGQVAERKSVYARIIHSLIKRIHFEYMTSWKETSKLFYMLVFKKQMSAEEENAIIELVKSKDSYR